MVTIILFPIIANYLEDLYEELKNMKEPQKRGIKFEDFLYYLFRGSGLLCQKNVHSSFGEEIDLIVKWGQYLSLIEAKWQNKPISLIQLQAFQWRLKQRGNATLGIFIALNGFSKPAEEIATKLQEKSLLLLNEDDIVAVISQKVDLDELLWEKLWKIQEHKMIYWTESREIFDLKSLKIPPYLISQNKQWILSDINKRVRLTHNQTQGKDVADTLIFTPSFELYASTFDEYRLFSRGYRTLHGSIKNLNQLLDYFNYFFGFSEEGSYGISQNTINWSGFGIKSFIKDLKEQKRRYDSIDSKSCHSRENLIFFQPLNISGSFFIFEIYTALIHNLGIDAYRYRFNQFNVMLVILEEENIDAIRKRIDRFCELSSFEYQINKIQLDVKKLVLEENMICVEPAKFILKSDYSLLLKKEVTVVQGIIFKNPCNINIELKKRIKKFFPQLLLEDLWIGFTNGLHYPISKKLYLNSIRYLTYHFPGSRAHIFNLVIVSE